MRTTIPRKSRVTGVGCVTESLEASNGAASSEVTRNAKRMNTEEKEHLPCYTRQPSQPLESRPPRQHSPRPSLLASRSPTNVRKGRQGAARRMLRSSGERGEAC